MRHPLLIGALLLTACERAEKTPAPEPAPDPAVAQVDSAPPSGSDRSKRDSTEFSLFLDSVRALQHRVDSLGSNPAAAALLYRIGQMKRHADNWTYYGGPGWQYASALRDVEYFADEANAHFVYNAKDWIKLIQVFPDDSLADDAAWGIANHGLGGDCEGETSCYLNLRFEPMLEFLSKYPHSNFDSAAVAQANEALTSILADIPNLRVRDTSSTDPDYDPSAVESALVRYDSAAQRLSPSLRAAVNGVTGPLWGRLGKPHDH